MFQDRACYTFHLILYQQKGGENGELIETSLEKFLVLGAFCFCQTTWRLWPVSSNERESRGHRSQGSRLQVTITSSMHLTRNLSNQKSIVFLLYGSLDHTCRRKRFQRTELAKWQWVFILFSWWVLRNLVDQPRPCYEIKQKMPPIFHLIDCPEG